MSKNINHIQHVKSNVVLEGKPKLPQAESLVDGELAINYASGVETISIKNASGDIVTFSSDNYYTEQKLGSGFTGENSANTVTSVIEENERIISSALNDLEEKKLDVSAYTEVWLSGTGLNSIVQKGTNCTASGTMAIAEGNTTTASGDLSHSEGNRTTASGTSSHAEGGGTRAIGVQSHAEGGGTYANGANSHAEGYMTEANNESEHASGQYNVSSSASTTFGDSGNTLFSVGNGTSSARHNAFEIRQNGDIYIVSGSSDIKLQDYLGNASITVDQVIDSGTSASTNAVSTSAVYGFITAYTPSISVDQVIDETTSASTNAVSTKAVVDKIVEDERVWAIALNQLNNEKFGYASFDENEKSINFYKDSAHTESAITTVDLSDFAPDMDDYYTKNEVDDRDLWVSGTGVNSIVQKGTSCTASGACAVAEGSGTTAGGDYSHSEGEYSVASGFSSHAEGGNTKAIGMFSHAEGHATAYGDTAHAEGFGLAYGSYSHAEGNGSIASGFSSHVEGQSTSALTLYSHAEGNGTIANGESSHAEGNGTMAIGQSSHSEGNNTKTFSAYSHAEGSNTIASGGSSHAEGYESQTYGENSHAEGNGTRASGTSSHAEGYGVKSVGTNSHGEGYLSMASGNTSHAEGYDSHSNGDYSHAEGHQTYSNGENSHAEGNGSIASGNSSHAEGKLSKAYGDYSHTEGYMTDAKNKSEHASGQYNISSSGSSTFGDSGNTLFSIGNGTADDSRHNAFEIRQNGDIYIVSGGTDILLQDNLGGNITIDQVIDSGTSASTNAVSTKAVYDVIVDNEFVWANAFSVISGAIDTHSADTTVHVTAGDKSSWNAKADLNHTHEASGVTAMTGYQIAASSADVLTTDSLLQTIGKLEKRIALLEAALGGMTLVKLTSQEYNDLQVKDPNTMYIIND